VHGYLDKSKSTEKRKYYDLLSNSRLFVNTTQGWSGFQAILEAMYFYNPIIIRPNDIVNDYFTNLENFAYLLDGNVLMLESIIIESVSNIARYQKMSDVAHKTVKSSTWNNFTNELINIIR
jgi:glycosyltransferase involved in cell wall biosynthesis